MCWWNITQWIKKNQYGKLIKFHKPNVNQFYIFLLLFFNLAVIELRILHCVFVFIFPLSSKSKLPSSSIKSKIFSSFHLTNDNYINSLNFPDFFQDFKFIISFYFEFLILSTFLFYQSTIIIPPFSITRVCFNW